MDITVTYVGNATTLVSAGGLTLLTDPNFLHRGQRAYLGHGLVSKRLKEPALRLDELPPIDAIVLSHMHGDHWDRVSQKGLDHGLPVVTT
ncbi:MBL fold metallo-hydrolase, partial [Mycobacterium sp.]|uniref:MBL fold metallo-hydrolase n=1 Tax=Mycobacterium sp. TaxID=1785 RepID=UPI003F7D7B79